jgi:hypothetical protein
MPDKPDKPDKPEKPDKSDKPDKPDMRNVWDELIKSDKKTHWWREMLIAHI